jgi:hypothetical protein
MYRVKTAVTCGSNYFTLNYFKTRDCIQINLFSKKKPVTSFFQQKQTGGPVSMVAPNPCFTDLRNDLVPAVCLIFQGDSCAVHDDE